MTPRTVICSLKQPGGCGVFRVPIVAVVLSVLAFGCGGDAAMRQPVATVLVAQAANDINPDRDGRPSPVVIRLFGQRDASKFASLALGELLVAKREEISAWATFDRELTLVPGGSISEEVLIPPDTRAVAVIAGFREYRTGVFRDASELPKDRKDRLRAPKRIEVSVTGKVVRLNVVP